MIKTIVIGNETIAISQKEVNSLWKKASDQTTCMKKTFICFALCLSLFTSLSLDAQEEFIESPSKLITRIPFLQLSGGIVILQAKLGDFPDTLNFVLDTGSSGISLDSSTVDYLKLNLNLPIEQYGVLPVFVKWVFYIIRSYIFQD